MENTAIVLMISKREIKKGGIGEEEVGEQRDHAGVLALIGLGGMYLAGIGIDSVTSKKSKRTKGIYEGIYEGI